MSYQYIINTAESIGFNCRQVVASTTTRSGITRSVGRGGQTWRIQVTPPRGPSWSDNRANIAMIEKLDRTAIVNIKFDSPGHAWMTGYQGTLDPVAQANLSATYTQGSATIFLNNATAGAVKAGDFVQLGNGRVYQAVATSTNQIVQLNRPVIEANGSAAVKLGQACTWRVQCVDFPSWNIFARDQVSWSGSFVFVESDQ